MFKTLTSALLAAVSCAMTSKDFRFMKWIAEQNKVYEHVEEFEMRKANWLETDAIVQKVNNSPEEFSHTAGHN